MKIYIVCWRLSFGGAERVGVLLADGLARRGNEVTMVADLFDPVTYQLDSNVKLRNLVSSQSKLRKWISSVINLRRYLLEDRPDAIIGILNATSLIALIASIGLHIPIVMTEHDAFERPASAPFTFWKRFAKFTLNKLYRHVTVLTSADKMITGEHLGRARIHVMPNPLALQPLNWTGEGWKTEDGTLIKKRPIVLAAGRLEDWHLKGFDLLLKAWSMQEQSIREEWKLEIAGKETPESLAYLKGLCKKYNIEDSVKFLGFREDIDKLMQQASVFVLSSRYEGFGLVLIEAMSQGCACIAADYNGRQKEIFGPSHCGLPCKTEDAMDLAEKMKLLMVHPEDRLPMQQLAVERSRDFSVEKIAAKWEALLNEIIGKRP
jgi:GalNAc-alpha-(1->4)-GalNAc-alpha-(1->3)-diNAcBac-PP-undecaprenol alpha-1,4-N-acetyl-D-galactosaminyltransferase